MVTRTVMLTVTKVMCLDVTTAKVEVKTFELSGSFATTDSVLAGVKKLHETDTFKCVAVQEMVEKEVLYGMSEIDFIKSAKVLPARGNSATETEATEN